MSTLDFRFILWKEMYSYMCVITLWISSIKAVTVMCYSPQLEFWFLSESQPTFAFHFVYSQLNYVLCRAWYRCYLMLFSSYWGQIIQGHHYAKIKVVYGSSVTSRIGFISYMGTYARNPEWAYWSDSTLPIHPYSPVAWKGGSLTKHYT